MNNKSNSKNSAALVLFRTNAAFLYFALAVVCSLVACEKADFAELDDEEENSSSVETSSLTVVTRSSDDEKVSYPVNVYVMDDSGKCVDLKRLDSESDKLQFSLTPGTYDVYAIAGADEESYELPTKDNAQKTSEVVLCDDMEHGDLMSSSDNVVVAKGETNTLTLTMSRKVSEVEAVKIEGVPSEATAVEITLSPLVKNICLDGSNSVGTTSKTLSLTKSSTSGTWVSTSTYYILESTSNLTIKVGMTVGGSKSSYTCNYKGKVEANHKLTINGKYNDNTVTLQGVLTGAKWGDPVTIDFEIGEDSTDNNGSSGGDDSDTGDDTQSGEAISVGSVYDNCVVVKSVKSGSSTTVTLMTLDEYNKLSYSSSQKGKDNAKFQAEIESCIDATLAFFDDENLRLPTIEELEYVYDNREAINEYIEAIDINAPLIELKASRFYCGYYYLADDGYIYVYMLDGQIDKEPNPNRVTYKVRGFKTLTFTE